MENIIDMRKYKGKEKHFKKFYETTFQLVKEVNANCNDVKGKPYLSVITNLAKEYEDKFIKAGHHE